VIWVLVVSMWVPILLQVIRDATKDDGGLDWNMLSTVAIAAATTASVVVAVFQWSALHSTDDKIGRQLSLIEADQRAWLSSSLTITGNLTPGADGLIATIPFTLKNTGKSPAIDAFVAAELTLSGWGPNQTKEVCEKAERSTLKLSIFPGDTLFQSIGANLPKAELDRFRNQQGRISAATVLPGLGACVAYRDVLTRKFHHTPSNFYISLAGRDASPLPMMLGDSPIPANSLMLVSVPIGQMPD
jgi:hypothetical protein